jgi:hypothetical protein
MRKYITLFFSVSLFLFACKGKNEALGIIDPNVMVNLLTEVHLVDGRLYNYLQNPERLQKYGMGRYLAAFKKYDTDSATFRKSLKFYTTQPDKLLNIYNKVQANLKLKLDSLNKRQYQIKDVNVK